jgi:hypothetical protein
MNTLITQMFPASNTNQAIGLSWALAIAGRRRPIRHGSADGPELYLRNVIILLTDGLKTQDRWYTDQNSIDARQKITCDNMNAANITLFTVQVNTAGDPGLGPAEELRRHPADPGRAAQVPGSEQRLRGHGLERDRHGVQPDRHQAVAIARLEVTKRGVKSQRPTR